MTGHQLNLKVRDKRQRLTVNCTTWLYIDCCCDTYPGSQRFPGCNRLPLRALT